MNRKYPKRPILGVGAIVVEDDRILLIRRGKEPGRGIWSIPGGRVKIGETARDAVLREVWEETGLRVKVLDFIEALDIIFRHPSNTGDLRLSEDGRVKYHYVVLDYLAVPEGGRLEASSDAVEARYFTPGEIDDLSLRETTTRVIRRALDAFNQKDR